MEPERGCGVIWKHQNWQNMPTALAGSGELIRLFVKDLSRGKEGELEGRQWGVWGKQHGGSSASESRGREWRSWSVAGGVGGNGCRKMMTGESHMSLSKREKGYTPSGLSGWAVGRQ
jgi:hypothetical protein